MRVYRRTKTCSATTVVVVTRVTSTSVSVIVDHIREAAAQQAIMLVAVDGRSGVGKSTLAASLLKHVDAVVVEGDDFYAGGTVEEWLEMTPSGRAAHCMDWRRQRPVLRELSLGNAATWYPFDWDAFDGRLSTVEKRAVSAPVVILEGVYSARPELADLFDLRILVKTSESRRAEQLRRREGDLYRDQWEDLWSSAEDHYFTHVMPDNEFDLVVVPHVRTAG